MKMVINKCFGGFGLSDECKKALGIKSDWDIERDDARLVDFVEKHGKSAGDGYAELVVIEIPDSATDWELEEYDGFESVIAVVDGKLVHL